MDMPMSLIANRYRVVAELGRGGMGTVYRVEDTREGNRALALKAIRAKGAVTPELMLRFKEEFRAMVKLQHPNTLAVYDFGPLDAQSHYLTMELVEGRDLGALLREGPLPLPRVYDLLLQLLQALGFIHARLFVHRDIKAENIRVNDGGVLKLMDFGLMDQLGIPASGKITGTPSYLPPEVAKGGVIDAGSDLYSVGCLAFELLTGRLPFAGGVLEVVRAHVHEAPPRLRSLRPDAPERLEAIVARLLEKEPRQRYRDASEAIADLADLAGVAVAREKLDQKRSYLTSSVLVGRDRELADLDAALADVRAGAGRAIFVGAPAGVGKSRLVQELLLSAKLEGLPVLLGQCLESGMAAYEPLAQALGPVWGLSTPEERARHGAALARILPEARADGHAPLAPLDANPEKLRLHAALTAWLSEVSARTPLVLFFDDMHWSDPQSLEAFNHLVRTLGGRPVLALGTFRNDEIPPSSPIWFTIEEGATRYLKLAPFNLAQVMLLLQAMLRDVRISKAFSEALFDATAGNAFFLTEVMRFLIEEGALTHKEGAWHFPADAGALAIPVSVEATVVRRLSQLSGGARDLARVASVLGRYQDREALVAVSGLAPEALFAHLEELTERQFLLKEEARYTFPHDRVREALYADTPEETRQDLHQRAAEYLERAHAGALDGVVNELAHHFARGRDLLKAYHYLREAGERAKAAGVGMAAIAAWQRAEAVLARLDHPRKEAEQVDLWFRIGSFGFEIFPSAAIDALEKSIRVLEAQGNVDAVCGVLKGAVGGIKRLPAPVREKILAQLTKPVPYTHKVRRGLARLVPPPPPAWVPRVIESYTFLGAAYGFAGQPGKGLAMVDRALTLLPFTETPLEGALRVASCVCLCPAGRYDEMLAAARLAGETLVDRDLTGIQVAQAARVGYADHMIACAFQGIRPDPAMLEYGLWAAGENDTPHLFNILWSRFGVYYAWTGRYEEASEIFERITQHSRKVGAPLHQWALYLRPYLLHQRGEFDEAHALIQQALRYPHLDHDDCVKQLLFLLKGQVAVARGELAAADDDLVAAEKRGRWGQMGLVIIQALLARAELDMARGDAAAARGRLAEALGLAAAGAYRNPLFEAVACRRLAELDLAEGRLEAAHERLARARAIVTAPEQDNPIEQGRLLALEGACRLAESDRESAKEAFRAAGALFHGLKNRHLLRPVAAQLEALQDREAGVRLAMPEEDRETRLSQLETRWRERHGEAFRTQLGDAEFAQETLASCLEALGAEEASLFLVEDGASRWAASRGAAGPLGARRTNMAYVEAALAGAPTVAIDVPDTLAIDAGSNLEAEIPSALVVPAVHAGRTVAVFYLLKRDIATPFAQEDLEVLAALAQHLAPALAERLARRTQAPDAAGVSRLVSELRASLHEKSLVGVSQSDLLAGLLEACATRLGLDAVAVLAAGSPPRVIGGYPGAGGLPPLDFELVATVSRSGQSVCRIEVPEALPEESSLGLSLPSVAVSPLAGGALYCLRNSHDTPLSETDLRSIEACAGVFAEALTLVG